MENVLEKMQKIVLIKTRRNFSCNEVNEGLKWLGCSLGLFGLRDKDSSCFRIFIVLLKKSKRRKGVSSDEIAEKLNLSRGTVVHHLKRLMARGLVIQEKRKYLLRETTLTSLVKSVWREAEATFEELKEIAQEIDERLGL